MKKIFYAHFILELFIHDKLMKIELCKRVHQIFVFKQ